MGGRRMRTVGLAVAIAGGGCSHNNSSPFQEQPPSATASASASPDQSVVPWPEVQACSTPGSYALSVDPDPIIRCGVAILLKDRIDGHRKLRYIRALYILITLVNVLCVRFCSKYKKMDNHICILVLRKSAHQI